MPAAVARDFAPPVAGLLEIERQDGVEFNAKTQRGGAATKTERGCPTRSSMDCQMSARNSTLLRVVKRAAAETAALRENLLRKSRSYEIALRRHKEFQPRMDTDSPIQVH